MEDRIKINNVWYIKEDIQNTSILNEIDESDITNSIHTIWETEEFCFEGVIILRDGAENLTDHYPDPTLTIIDKRPIEREKWLTHNVDNPNWLLGLLNDEPYIIEDAREMFDEIGIESCKLFIRYLIKKNWLKK